MHKLLSSFSRRFWDSDRNTGRVEAENTDAIGIARGLFDDDHELIWC